MRDRVGEMMLHTQSEVHTPSEFIRASSSLLPPDHPLKANALDWTQMGAAEREFVVMYMRMRRGCGDTGLRGPQVLVVAASRQGMDRREGAQGFGSARVYGVSTDGRERGRGARGSSGTPRVAGPVAHRQGAVPVQPRGAVHKEVRVAELPRADAAADEAAVAAVRVAYRLRAAPVSGH